VLEHALAELIEMGDVQRHVRLVHREYAARRDVLVQALRRLLDGALTFTVPGGGIALWTAAAADLDIDVWAARAKARGVVIETARSYAVDRQPRPYARLGFGSLDRKELVEAVRRLAAARPLPRRTPA
jgi:GntR family transcriptional regulator/MocR family aminotransferase